METELAIAVANSLVRLRHIKNSYRFRRAMGYPPRYIRPVTYGDKMQWRKLFERDPRFAVFCDKMMLRDYVKRADLPLKMAKVYWYGHDAEAIPFDSLPESFVLKPSHLSGRFLLCDDKRRFDIDHARTEAARWLRRVHGRAGREWAYAQVTRGIIAEEYLATPDELVVPPEYRVYCFSGQPKLVQLSIGKLTDDADLTFYDANWRQLPWCAIIRNERTDVGQPQPRPPFWEDMCRIAAKISGDFGHMRVDFFDVMGELYLAEITPYSASGGLIWVGAEADDSDRSIDQEMGALWPTPTRPIWRELIDAWRFRSARKAGAA